jgi:hypothetical protein
MGAQPDAGITPAFIQPLLYNSFGIRVFFRGYPSKFVYKSVKSSCALKVAMNFYNGSTFGHEFGLNPDNFFGTVRSAQR